MKKIGLLAAALLSIAPATFADDAPPNYAAVMGGYVLEDNVRAGDSGLAWHGLYGAPVNEWLSVELNAFGTRLDRRNSNVYDYQYALGMDFTGNVFENPRFRGFGIVGVGSIFEDFPGTEQLSPYTDVGFGVVAGLPLRGLSLRGDARYYAIFNTNSYPSKDVLFDAHVNLGLQYAFGEAAAAPPPPVFRDGDGDGVPDESDDCPNTPAGTPVTSRGCPLSLDDDRDGVPNDIDECPHTPPGTLVDARGCPAAIPLAPTDADEDGDGVVDSLDQCAGTRPGAVVDAVGCPVDEDGDGVLNALDQCPHTPMGLKVDERGCAVEAQSIVILRNVHFEFDKYELTREARIVLDGVVAGMKGQPTMEVELAGHCDALGTESYNLKLSQRRAAAVRTYLVDRGIDGARMKAEGYGEYQPIADNETEEGRAQNRRVEFKVVKQ